jgi:uncharacterized protein (DUF2147 family)
MVGKVYILAMIQKGVIWGLNYTGTKKWNLQKKFSYLSTEEKIWGGKYEVDIINLKTKQENLISKRGCWQNVRQPEVNKAARDGEKWQ